MNDKDLCQIGLYKEREFIWSQLGKSKSGVQVASYVARGSNNYKSLSMSKHENPSTVRLLIYFSQEELWSGSAGTLVQRGQVKAKIQQKTQVIKPWAMAWGTEKRIWCVDRVQLFQCPLFCLISSSVFHSALPPCAKQSARENKV